MGGVSETPGGDTATLAAGGATWGTGTAAGGTTPGEVGIEATGGGFAGSTGGAAATGSGAVWIAGAGGGSVVWPTKGALESQVKRRSPDGSIRGTRQRAHAAPDRPQASSARARRAAVFRDPTMPNFAECWQTRG
jgi:hypothetical protein